MLIRKRDIFSGKVVKLSVQTVKLPNGQTAELEIIDHPGGVAVLALDDSNQICLLQQYRYAASGSIWEIPAGT
ncbi:MAG: NUDIX hydrolase, partial [Pseudomonadota bacterium]